LLRLGEEQVSLAMDEQLLTLDLRDDAAGRPKYEQLRDHLVGEILAGRLKPGQLMPSQRRFSELLRIAPMTVGQAMTALEREGIIRRVQGKGTFVDADVWRKLKRGLDIFALIVPETREGYYPSLLHGFEEAASAIHHQTLICNTSDNTERQADIILQLLDKKVGGIALNPTDLPLTPAYQVRQIQERGIPVVFCHRGVEGVTAPLLSIPFREVGRLAGRTLAEHGHRRVACLLGSRSVSGREYETGIQEVFRAAGSDMPIQSTYYIEPGSIQVREEACWRALQQLFSQPGRPTAIFASFDSIAQMIYLLMPRLGLRIPEDVSLISEGGVWREDALTRRLTSVVIDEVGTGRKAVELLHEMRCGKRPINDGEEFVLPLGLSDGETVCRPKEVQPR
jgi:GntR family transcriptional regulator, arabinose operon transcriptional repressor